MRPSSRRQRPRAYRSSHHACMQHGHAGSAASLGAMMPWVSSLRASGYTRMGTDTHRESGTSLGRGARVRVASMQAVRTCGDSGTPIEVTGVGERQSMARRHTDTCSVFCVSDGPWSARGMDTVTMRTSVIGNDESERAVPRLHCGRLGVQSWCVRCVFWCMSGVALGWSRTMIGAWNTFTAHSGGTQARRKHTMGLSYA